MKRYGGLYEQVYDMGNLIKAHQNAKHGKGWYSEVKMVDSDIIGYLSKIRDSLINKTYHTSDYNIFIKDDGVKQREIHKLPYYPDRIVHWAIMQVIEPILMRFFTADTYSAIPNRGVHYGYNRVQNDLRTDPEGCVYCLKLDVKKFYPSIRHDILKSLYRRLIKDKDLLWLIDEIIDSVPDEKGIPIGNYLSQYSGNLYLAWFDHWIKEEKHVKHYHRYMDDIVIFGSDKNELRLLFDDIRQYLKDNLGLTIKDNWQIFPTKVRGVDFLGYRFFGDYTLLRDRTKRNMRHKLLKMKDKIKDIKSEHNNSHLTDHDISTMASYNGWLKYCDSYRLRRKYFEPITT